MRSDSAAAECLVPISDLPIMDGGEDPREASATREAVNSARLHRVVCERIVPHLALLHRDARCSNRSKTVAALEVTDSADPAHMRKLLDGIRSAVERSAEVLSRPRSPAVRRS